jgi:hypothetical protein
MGQRYNPQMEEFEQVLTRVLQSRPGLTKERLAAEMGADYANDFRKNLDLACDKGLAHKIQDKYYPGTRRAY